MTAEILKAPRGSTNIFLMMQELADDLAPKTERTAQVGIMYII